MATFLFYCSFDYFFSSKISALRAFDNLAISIKALRARPAAALLPFSTNFAFSSKNCSKACFNCSLPISFSREVFYCYNGFTMKKHFEYKFGDGNKVYLASPMFNQAEKDFNLKIAHVLEEYGYEVFLPQRDGLEAAYLEGKSEQELIDLIFNLDYQEVLKADIIFMNIDGRVPDEGANVELGMGYAVGKRCYGFKTDTRSIQKVLETNPMITGCMIKVFKNFDGDELIKEIREYLSLNKL